MSLWDHVDQLRGAILRSVAYILVLFVVGFFFKGPLFDGVVLPLLTPICVQLRKEREAEIRRNAVHTQQRQNELSCYQRRQSPIDQMLRKSTKFLQSEPYQRLRNDIRAFVDKINGPSTTSTADEEPKVSASTP